MIKNILFDFDGVILDSMPIREYGFRKIFENFDDKLVDKFLQYHNENGGLSRYVKIRYFYEELLNRDISEKEVENIADIFSTIMRDKLTDKIYLINETVAFLDKYHTNYNIHIVSGSDDRELRFLCKELDVDRYFISIYGSPTHKNDLVKNILDIYKYKREETILIGDSINDYNASEINGIAFYGYNNSELKSVSEIYLENFKRLYI